MSTPDLIDAVDRQLGQQLRRAYDRRAVRIAALDRAEALRAVQADLDAQIAENDQARVVIQAIEQIQQGQLKDKVQGLVTYALSTIFERDLRFEVEFDQRGSQTEARFCIRDEHDHQVSLRDAHGGGLLVTAAFVLRVVVALSIRPALRPLLVLDEPFVHVSDEYRDRLVGFIRSLAESAGLQFIIVTHLPELSGVGDVVYRFRLQGGQTVVEKL